MIEASFVKSSGRFTGFTVTGHAGYADSGSDIVCAGVSSAVQLTANAITESFGVPAKVRVMENRISLKLPRDCDSAPAQQLIEALYEHISLIAHDHQGTISTHISFGGVRK